MIQIKIHNKQTPINIQKCQVNKGRKKGHQKSQIKEITRNKMIL